MSASDPPNHWWQSLSSSFLGDSPLWYKYTIVGFLLLNPLVLWSLDALLPSAEPISLGMTVTAWMILLEFIFSLAMALRCYPLQSGGLLALEALFLGLTTPGNVYHELVQNFDVILLLMFMVAGIYFMRQLLLVLFSRLLVSVPSQTQLSLLFCGVAALLSAFLDALTVMAVLISVGIGFYQVYYKAVTATELDVDAPQLDSLPDSARADLEQFAKALRGLLMHGAVGTALGGVCTLVGEPQNLLIANRMSWHFMDFFWHMAPVTMPVLALGLLCCALLERSRYFGYGTPIPAQVRQCLRDYVLQEHAMRTSRQSHALLVQAVGGVLLVVALALHVAPVGLIGLALIVFLTAFNGVCR